MAFDIDFRVPSFLLIVNDVVIIIKNCNKSKSIQGNQCQKPLKIRSRALWSIECETEDKADVQEQRYPAQVFQIRDELLVMTIKILDIFLCSESEYKYKKRGTREIKDR